MSAAAKFLRISQPSLSSQLGVLERSLDLKLFRRVGRRNQLTSSGAVVYGYCKQMFEISEELGELLTKQVPTSARRIHIGVSEEVDRPFVVEVVSLFLTRLGAHQRPKVTVVSGKHEQLAERLRMRELDAVVTQMAMIDRELENLEKAVVPVALTCSSKWKLKSSKRHLKVGEAIKEIVGGEDAQWLMPSASYKLRAEINRFFEANQLKGRIVFESDVLASLVRSVVDGIGLAFLPLIYVNAELRNQTLRVIGPKQGYWKTHIWLACHMQNRNDPLTKALSASFNEICERSSS